MTGGAFACHKGMKKRSVITLFFGSLVLSSCVVKPPPPPIRQTERGPLNPATIPAPKEAIPQRQIEPERLQYGFEGAGAMENAEDNEEFFYDYYYHHTSDGAKFRRKARSKPPPPLQ